LSGQYTVRDLWRKENVGTTDAAVSAELRPHASAFYKLTPR